MEIYRATKWVKIAIEWILCMKSQEQKRLQLRYLPTVCTLTLNLCLFKTNIKQLKTGGKKIVLVWENASYHINSKEKSFTLKMI